MKRFIAHHVEVDGVVHGLSVVTVMDDGTVTVQPFVNELHSTRWVDGTLKITTTPGARPLIEANGRPLDW